MRWRQSGKSIKSNRERKRGITSVDRKEENCCHRRSITENLWQIALAEKKRDFLFVENQETGKVPPQKSFVEASEQNDKNPWS